MHEVNSAIALDFRKQSEGPVRAFAENQGVCRIGVVRDMPVEIFSVAGDVDVAERTNGTEVWNVHRVVEKEGSATHGEDVSAKRASGIGIPPNGLAVHEIVLVRTRSQTVRPAVAVGEGASGRVVGIGRERDDLAVLLQIQCAEAIAGIRLDVKI